MSKNESTIRAAAEQVGEPARNIVPSKLPNPNLVIWCHEHPWEAAHEIERLRGSLEIAGEGDGAL